MASSDPILLVPEDKIAELWPTYTEDQRLVINKAISNLIQEYCNTTFDERAYVSEVYDSMSPLVLLHMPIVSVTKLESRSGTEWTELIQDTDYFVYPDKIIIDNPSSNRKSIRLDYSAGLLDIPQLVYEVAVELLNYRFFKEGEGAFLFYKGQTFEEREYETDRDMNELKILSKLARYIQRSAKKASGKGTIRVGVI